MGAGLAPWVYGLAPAVLLAFLGCGLNWSRSFLLEVGRLAGLSIAFAATSWLVAYTYLVKIAGFPSAGFFTLKMLIGLLSLTFAITVMFRLRGFFRKSPR
jgi:hypothetical protein